MDIKLVVVFLGIYLNLADAKSVRLAQVGQSVPLRGKEGNYYQGKIYYKINLNDTGRFQIKKRL
jgi:hypothetical protein